MFTTHLNLFWLVHKFLLHIWIAFCNYWFRPWHTRQFFKTTNLFKKFEREEFKRISSMSWDSVFAESHSFNHQTKTRSYHSLWVENKLIIFNFHNFTAVDILRCKKSRIYLGRENLLKYTRTYFSPVAVEKLHQYNLVI